jgi:autotransporter-associated beta strand protein
MHLHVLSYRLTRIGGQLVSVGTCALTGRVRAGALALAMGLGLASGASALDVLIVNTGAYAGTDTAIAARQTAAGNTTTILGVGALGADLSAYDQIWDMGYSVGLGTSYATSLTSYLQGGGTLFLMGENPGAAPIRNPAITSFLTAAGAGAVSISGYGTGAAQTIASQFQVNNTVATVTFAGSGKFGNVGTGTCITSDCTAAAWGAGTLANATAGTVISVLDINFLTSGYLAPNFTDNLIAYLQQQQEIGSGGGTPATDIGTGATSYDASNLGAQLNPAFKGGTLNIDAPAMTLAQNFTVDAAGGTLQANGTAATLTGVISDEAAGTPGALSITGSGGTVTLAGANTYTGATTVAAGSTLALTGSGSIAASSGLANAGTFDISGTTGGASIATLSGAGAVALGSKTLTLSAAGGSFAGSIGGSGGLAVTGGTETLTGANGYTGATTIGSGATLVLSGNGSIAASSGVVANGTLDVSATGGAPSIAGLSGNGNVVLGAKNLALTGASGNFAGSIAGSGGVAVNGGTQVLSGANAYTGATQVGSGATLGLAGAGSVAASSGVANAGTFDISGASSGTTVNALTGAGSVVLGSRTLTISTASTAFTGSFSGTGGVTVNGGQLTLTGTQAYTGLTTVGSGALLSLNGLSAGGVSVQSGGTLKGSGAIAGPVTVAAGGKLSPGNSPGVLTVGSTVTLAAGSSFEVEINGAAAGNGAGFHDQLNIVGAGNQFVANGATLDVNLTAISGLGAYTPYVPTLGQTFRIVTAEGGLGTTRFASLVQPDGLAAGTRLRVVYNMNGSNAIDLRVVPGSFAVYGSGRGLNRNAISAAAAVDRMLEADDAGTATTAQGQLANTVLGLNAAQFDGRLTGLAGEIHGAIAAAQPLAGQGLQNTVAKHLALTGSSTSENGAAWVDYSSGDARWTADSVSSAVRSSRNQFTVGVDVLQTASTRIGVAAALSTTQVASSSGGNGKLEDNLGVVYGQQALGGLTADAQLGYGSGHARSTRADPMASLDPTVYSANALTTDLRTRQTFAGAGLRLPMQVAGVSLEPFVRVGTQRLKRDAGAENSSTPSALSLGEMTATGTRVSTGLSLASTDTNPTVARHTYRGTLSVGQDSGALLRPVVSATLAGVATTIEAPQVGRSFVQANVFGTWLLAPGAYAYAGISGEARSQRVEKSATVGASLAF